MCFRRAARAVLAATAGESVRAKGKTQSAENISGTLIEKGLKPISGPFQATVGKMKGPLTECDLDRAFEFGKEVGQALNG